MQAMNTFKNIIALLITQVTLLLLFSCKSHKSNSLIEGLEISADTINIASSLSRAELLNMFDSEMTKHQEIRWTDGFTGKESGQSLRYKWFSNWASNEELLNLVDSKNTNTKVYAFLALKNRKNLNLKEITLKHLSDTSLFVETYGCVGYSKKRINSFFFEESIGWFTKNEELKYRSIISKLNSNLHDYY